MADDCSGGQNATLNVNNTDCSCVSIASIVWNGAGTQFTITLNNGQSITSPDLTGPEGVPDVSFRVSGTTLQYSINGGTSWVNLYDLSSILNEGALTNQFPNLATLGTAYETLISNAAGTARTPFSLPANTLATNEDAITIHAVFTATGASTSTLQRVRILFNAGSLSTPLNWGFGGGLAKIEFDAKLVRVSNTTIKYELKVKTYMPSFGGGYMQYDYTQDVTTIAGLNLASNAYDLDAQGDSVVIGDITCTAFNVNFIPKLS